MKIKGRVVKDRFWSYCPDPKMLIEINRDPSHTITIRAIERTKEADFFDSNGNLFMTARHFRQGKSWLSTLRYWFGNDLVYSLAAPSNEVVVKIGSIWIKPRFEVQGKEIEYAIKNRSDGFELNAENWRWFKPCRIGRIAPLEASSEAAFNVAIATFHYFWINQADD